MNRLSRAALAAFAVACLSQTAAPAQAQDRVSVSARVRYSDLNLASPAGRAVFEARIHRVATSLCTTHAQDLAATADAGRCRREVIASGRQQLAMLKDARDTQVASK
jgi:UrcA family protein